MSRLERLAEAGIDLGGLPDGQREVLAGLSVAEVDVLIDVKRRLDEAEGDVEGHNFGESGGAYW